MEKVWVVWTEDHTSQNIPFSQSLMQGQALTLFNPMRDEKGEEATKAKSEASRSWFMRLQDRSRLHSTKVPGEAAGADGEAAAGSPEALAQITHEGDYTEPQIFNVEETAFYWKKMPSRTFIAREEKSMSGFKEEVDSLVRG